MHLSFVLIALTFLSIGRSFALTQSTWHQYLVEEVIRPKAHVLFDDLEYAKTWRPDREFVIDSQNRSINKNEAYLRCQSRKLYPSHPYQTTKEYHAALSAEYDYTKLPANSDACQIPNPSRRFCVRAGYAKVVLTSDLYVDECGNHYRGYWVTTYLSLHESMGTLFSKGRTAYQRLGSSFRGDYVTGNTYATEEKDFIYLTPLSSQDRLKLNSALETSTRFFTKRNNIFLAR